VAAALLALLALPGGAAAHGSSPEYRASARLAPPAVAGLRVEVLGGADRLRLTNRTGRTVVVAGYAGEPYARLLASGEVQVNDRSPAAYLNRDRAGRTAVPPGADATAAPRWRTVGRGGRLEWHDYRMHWMGAGLPPAVRDRAVDTKVFDYRVPLTVAGRSAGIVGALFWTGAREPAPPVAFVLLALVGLGVVAVVAVERRRTRRAPARAGAW
jgi:hypothetical protein